MWPVIVTQHVMSNYTNTMDIKVTQVLYMGMTAAARRTGVEALIHILGIMLLRLPLRLMRIVWQLDMTGGRGMTGPKIVVIRLVI
jgi:hypothetical protein